MTYRQFYLHKVIMPKAIDAIVSKYKIGYKDLFGDADVQAYTNNTIENMTQLLEVLSKGFNISLDDEMGNETAAEMMFKYIMEQKEH